LLNQILAQCEAAGLLKGQRKQRTDSTRVLAKIRSLNRVELAGETMRRVLDDIAQIAPDWLREHIKKDWGKRYGSPIDTHAIRKSKAKLEKLAQSIGEDGHYLLAAIYQEDTPPQIRALFTVEVLRQVWVQQYYLVEGQSYWRKKDEQGFPTSGAMIASPDDLDARYSSKYGVGWTGYKLHVTETCDPEEPRLITQVTTTEATVPDTLLSANWYVTGNENGGMLMTKTSKHEGCQQHATSSRTNNVGPNNNCISLVRRYKFSHASFFLDAGQRLAVGP
jgi:transposase